MIEIKTTTKDYRLGFQHGLQLHLDCQSGTFQTRGPTDFCNRCKGKLGEIKLEEWFRKSGVKIIHSPLRPSYAVKSSKDDFVVESNSGELLTIELKTTSGIQYDGKPKRGFDALIPMHQHIDQNYNLVIFGGHGRSFFLLGWSTWADVDKCRRDRDMRTPAIRVPFKALRPMSELLEVVR